MELWEHPVPKTLTEDQWKKLFSLKVREFRFDYIKSILQGREQEMYSRIKVFKILITGNNSSKTKLFSER